jgi:NAD(P)H-dependent flavin oxidoreductase YrpB (nitropropane dioxygenase family)
VLATDFTRLVGCRAPIQLAPMPGIATVELAAAVTNAGGLGMIGTPLLPASVLADQLDALASAASGPFGAGFLVPFLDEACVEIAASRTRVTEFFYGEPDRRLVERVHAGGALACWQVGSRDEGLRAVDAGSDLIVAQGTEAGGHVRGTVGLLPLLTQLLDVVDVPVVAAGGIGTARDVAAVLAAGAAAVRLGTRFVAAEESGAHPRYVAALLAAGPEDTLLTQAFSVMWPDAPHRVLRSCVEAAHALEGETTGETTWGGAKLPVPRFGVVVPTRETTGAVEAMALYAGESVGAVRRVQPAAEIVTELLDGAERLLARARTGRAAAP